MLQRIEPRITKAAAIRVFGMDSRGRPVNVAASTVDVSRHGARVAGVKCWDAPGETIGVRYGVEKARYRVVWVGMPGTAIEGQLGLTCIESDKYIWGVTPVVTESRPLLTPNLGPRTLGPQFGSRPVAERYTDKRRQDQRFRVHGGANVREAGKNVPQWTTLHDLSRGGCYLETTAPLPLQTRVDLTIQVGDIKMDARGVVAVRHPLVGMGIKFMEMTPLNRDRLIRLLVDLEHSESKV
jgi:hypothetical protein